MLSVSLKPVAGFCIKTSTLHPSSYTPSSLKSHNARSTSTRVPQGLKIFVNVAWDANVPPPPDGNEEAIQRAMSGDELDKGNLDDWFVPVIVSEGRFDTDKGGKPSLVFDCVYHNSVKSRTLRDPGFKIFIIELSLQRIEAQTELSLSRQIGTPNIAAKGKLQPRTVSIPSVLARPDAVAAETHGLESKFQSIRKPLIEEITTQESSDSAPIISLDVQKPKSILKNTSNKSPQMNAVTSTAKYAKIGVTLTWSWCRTGDDSLQIQIEVPSVEKAIISRSNLDIEPRRLIFSIPDYPILDLNLSLSDAELFAHCGPGSTNVMNSTDFPYSKEDDSAINKLLALKRQRPFNVEGATAEWFMADDRLLISA
ncbi:pre-RNA processing PIH1/Nop17-domain-containing protein [Lentinula aff. detonsa]|uniref:Pre-RNA processing PIH1/Nop17-domain-containing protein n=1 Tax=Lentinula aff. detonsa TaxID=2804958 RepID=A0AA38NCE3_9AGAR|nr:pre-RNA processing PIH1/Nop17-domain-containing protein [Lentinula aff. detonsa]